MRKASQRVNEVWNLSLRLNSETNGSCNGLATDENNALHLFSIMNTMQLVSTTKVSHSILLKFKVKKPAVFDISMPSVLYL